jgi:hypothetical protein
VMPPFAPKLPPTLDGVRASPIVYREVRKGYAFAVPHAYVIKVPAARGIDRDAIVGASRVPEPVGVRVAAV